MTHEEPHPRPGTAPLEQGGFKSSWLYRLMLCGTTSKRPRFDVAELWPGDPTRGHDILCGNFTFREETHVLTSCLIPPAHASPQWLAWFHGLCWLTDLKSLSDTSQGTKAAELARKCVLEWVTANRKWTHPAWLAVVTADRIVHLCSAWNFLCDTEMNSGFEKSLRQTAGRDMRHLFKSTPTPDHDYARLHVIKGQFFAAFILMASERCQQKVTLRLEKEIAAQVLPDGGHIERNPECLSWVLQDLLDLRVLCCTALGHVPPFLQNAIDRSAPMVRALRHSDGKLGVFNGGLEGDALTLDRLLGLTDPTTLPPISAPYTGFQKISAGATSILMDCGKPGGPGISHHAGTLSFEVCVKQYRMIVNCGAHVGPSDPWRTALAATAAHSTLTINDTSSAAFCRDGRLRRGPDDVSCVRKDGEDGTLIEARHDGYEGTFGLIHQRSLFLSPTGDDIRGEDRIIGTGGEYATVRFHLHPDVHVSLLGGGNSALLQIGTKTKQTWRFKSSVGDIKLEESIYIGRVGPHRRTEQIIITTPLSGNGSLIKWSLTQEGK